MEGDDDPLPASRPRQPNEVDFKQATEDLQRAATAAVGTCDDDVMSGTAEALASRPIDISGPMQGPLTFHDEDPTRGNASGGTLSMPQGSKSVDSHVRTLLRSPITAEALVARVKHIYQEPATMFALPTDAERARDVFTPCCANVDAVESSMACLILVSMAYLCNTAGDAKHNLFHFSVLMLALIATKEVAKETRLDDMACFLDSFVQRLEGNEVDNKTLRDLFIKAKMQRFAKELFVADKFVKAFIEVARAEDIGIFGNSNLYARPLCHRKLLGPVPYPHNPMVQHLHKRPVLHPKDAEVIRIIDYQQKHRIKKSQDLCGMLESMEAFIDADWKGPESHAGILMDIMGAFDAKMREYDPEFTCGDAFDYTTQECGKEYECGDVFDKTIYRLMRFDVNAFEDLIKHAKTRYQSLKGLFAMIFASLVSKFSAGLMVETVFRCKVSQVVCEMILILLSKIPVPLVILLFHQKQQRTLYIHRASSMEQLTWSFLTRIYDSIESRVHLWPELLKMPLHTAMQLLCGTIHKSEHFLLPVHEAFKAKRSIKINLFAEPEQCEPREKREKREPRETDTLTLISMTPGARDVTPGARDVTPGARDVTPGARDVTPGARDVTPGAPKSTCQAGEVHNPVSPGMWTPGMWSPGMWTPGMWTPGMWPPGMWPPGMWPTGMWPTGMCPPEMCPPEMCPPGMWPTEMCPPGMCPTGMNNSMPSPVQQPPVHAPASATMPSQQDELGHVTKSKKVQVEEAAQGDTTAAMSVNQWQLEAELNFSPTPSEDSLTDLLRGIEGDVTTDFGADESTLLCQSD